MASKWVSSTNSEPNQEPLQGTFQGTQQGAFFYALRRDSLFKPDCEALKQPVAMQAALGERHPPYLQCQ